MSEDKKYTPQQEKEITDYLTRPPTPMETWVKNTTANNADPGSFKKAVTMDEHIQKNLDMFETPEPKPKKVTEDKRDFNDKRGKRFINKTTTAVENPNNPRAVAFNPTTQLFTNEKRDIAFKTYDEAETWNKAIGAKTKYYPDEATPEQVGALAYRLEKSRQMNGGDGRYDKPKPKPFIKKKKITTPIKINFSSPIPAPIIEPYKTDPYTKELQRRVEENIRKTNEEKARNATSGLAGLIGGFK